MSSQLPGLFQSKKPSASKKQADAPNPLEMEMESTVSRLRVLEERYTNLQREVQVTEENMISRHKRATIEIKTLTSDINEIRREITEMKDKILQLIKGLQSCAKKEDVRVIEKYIQMWEPLNFITRNELDEIIDEKLGNKRQIRNL